MRSIINSYMKAFGEKSKKHKRILSIFIMLALIVATGVTWRLKLTGMSMSNEVYCGKDEHTHTDACYRVVPESEVTASDVIVEDDTVASGFVKILICEKEEHIHSMACMSDETADLEKEEDWDRMTSELRLKGVSYAQDLKAIAESQVGYQESTRNFVVPEVTTKKNGISRYGQWYGNPYGDWNTMFVAYCLHQAGVSPEVVPYNSGVEAWIVDLTKKGLYHEMTENDLEPGDVVFIDTDGDDQADRAGIVTELVKDENDENASYKVKVVEGDVRTTLEEQEAAEEKTDIVEKENDKKDRKERATETADQVAVVEYLLKVTEDVQTVQMQEVSPAETQPETNKDSSDLTAEKPDGTAQTAEPKEEAIPGEDAQTAKPEEKTENVQAEMTLPMASEVPEEETPQTAGQTEEIREDAAGQAVIDEKDPNILTDETKVPQETAEKTEAKFVGYVRIPQNEADITEAAATGDETVSEQGVEVGYGKVKKYLAGTKRFYFDSSNTSWFGNDGAKPYICINGETEWHAMTAEDAALYYYDVPIDGFSSLRFRRGLSSTIYYGMSLDYSGGTIGSNNYFKANAWTTDSDVNDGDWSTDTDTFHYVYYDASYSKLSYAVSVSLDGAIPRPGENVYFHAWNSDSDKQTGKCFAMEPYTSTDGLHTWKDIYRAKLNKQYANILFFSSTSPTIFPAENNYTAQTIDAVIDWSYDKPCFYADTSDQAIYKDPQWKRSGYWAELYTLRDVETGKSRTILPLVKDSFDETETSDGNVFYMNSEFFDYYSDYELNGSKRASYDESKGGSHRNYVNFRQFDQALSDYYENANVVNTAAIYTGHFQPDIYGEGASPFLHIQGTMGLYGWSDYQTFISVNNSNLDIYGNTDKYDTAAVGIVDSTLSSGDLMVKDKSGGTVQEPHFNKEFLTGQNSKNAVLGKIYEKVAFPFVKQQVFEGDTTEYYWFDSARTTMQLKKNTNGSSNYDYYLDGTPYLGTGTDYRQAWAYNVNFYGNNYSINDPISRKYGFFPFNNVSGNEGNCASKYDYGFGTKLTFDFKIPAYGTVDNTPSGNPVRFRFSGDDDVWIFVDDELVLDLGGGHGQVQGMIDFSGNSGTKKAYISKIKDVGSGAYSTWTNISSSPVTLNYLFGENKDGNNHGNGEKTTVQEQYNFQKNFTLAGDENTVHTITVYYMERGLWESNFSMVFNFPTVKSTPIPVYELPQTGGSGSEWIIYCGITILLLGCLYYRCVIRQFKEERRQS